MTQLKFSSEELLADYDYASPHVVAGHRLHGGFDADGRYLPPRSLHRARAIQAWADALRSRGGEPLRADASLLRGYRYPNTAQMKLLLRRGLGQTFWNNLTITGKIEARGRVLAEMTFPEFQDVVEEDTSNLAIGHLNKGLLKAHGVDEGGEPDKGIGGHDVMWFALRDLAFGAGAYPDVEPPERIGRDSGEREAPELPGRYEELIGFLLNLLMIEFRAEIGFAFSQELLRDPELFQDHREQALEAAEVVERIRTDELIHVDSLRVYLGELRSLTFRKVDGGLVPGSEIIDPLWERLVHWATVEQPKLMVEEQRKVMRERILQHADGAKIYEEFEALADVA
jgi:hypothetical protein